MDFGVFLLFWILLLLLLDCFFFCFVFEFGGGLFLGSL